MSALELLQDPQLIGRMTIWQKITVGLQVTLLGMMIVFLVLLLLMFFLNLLKKVTPTSELQMTESKPEIDDNQEEIAAVITAVLFSCFYQHPSRIQIKNIVRLKDDVPIWGRAARGGRYSATYFNRRCYSGKKLSG